MSGCTGPMGRNSVEVCFRDLVLFAFRNPPPGALTQTCPTFPILESMMRLTSLLIWISTVSGWSIESMHRHSVTAANYDACRSVRIVNKVISVWCFCLLEGPTGTYGKVWEGTSPAPQSRLTHLTILNVDSFVFHKVLGKGSFGKVHI